MQPFEMRRSDRAISEERARDILERGKYGVLSLVGEEKRPYGIPLSYVVEGDAIYFHCALEGRKIRCMAAHPLVSFCVVGKVQPKHRPQYFTTLYESVIVEGEAWPVEQPEEKTKALAALCRKYFPDLENVDQEAVESARNSMKRTGVYRIEIRHISGKSNIPPNRKSEEKDSASHKNGEDS